MAKKKIENEANTEEVILNTAYNLLAKKGYANVSTREIASAAGVALSQLSYYYKSKGKLILAIVKISCEKIINELKEVVSKEKTNKQNFEAFTKYFKQIIKKEPELFKIIADFMGQALWDKEIKLYIYHLFRELIIMVQEFILSTEEIQPIYKGLPIDYVAELVIYGVFGVSLHSVLGKSKNNDLDSEIIASFLFGDELN